MDCHSLLWGLFQQVSNLDLLHCRQILYSLSHQGSPILCCGHPVNHPVVVGEDHVVMASTLPATGFLDP